MNKVIEVTERIPHRPPFLWVDSIVERSEYSLTALKEIPEDLDVFRGHYPHHPVLPGVLVCEAVFQTGALLISYLLEDKEDGKDKVPVVTRIEGAKFKRMVQPGDVLEMKVDLKEQLSSAYFLKGRVKVNGKTVAQVEFGCTLTST